MSKKEYLELKDSAVPVWNVGAGVAKKKHPYAGCMKGIFTNMSDDFNEPLEDFKEYM